MANIRTTTFELMCELGLTTVFGNPGSTEETFLKDFPDDFKYILGLQEASVMAMADGFSQAVDRPAFVNLHTAPGLGNAIGNLATAWHNKTPLIVTTGQQTREMLLIEPWLTNFDATMLPRPYIKWSYEPARAADVPGALMRAFATAWQSPAAPVYLSLPLDDWEKPAKGKTEVRGISRRVAPDPERLRAFADLLAGSKNPALVFGAGVDRSQAWQEAVRLAEVLRATVFAAPAAERAGFPENHPHFNGALPFAIKPLADKLKGHDVVLVVGAPVFRYYPYVAGDYLPAGTQLLHITDDPNESARAPVGDSSIADARLALASLVELIAPNDARRMPEIPREQSAVSTPKSPLTADDLFAAIARVRPADAVIVEESPSNLATLHRRLPTTKPASFFTMASGGLGWGLPAAIGIALGERAAKRNRPVLAIIGDGSFQYSIQALWTAAQQSVPVVFIVPRNDEYAILKAFAVQEKTPNVPGLDVPGIDFLALAKGYGCAGLRAETADEVSDAIRQAVAAEHPTVIEVPIDKTVPPLL